MRILGIITVILILFSQCNGQDMKRSIKAPELETKSGWLNTDQAYQLSDFRGKIVLLDFWTFGCINCQHILPDLKKLEEEYPNELVVIGVHSAKFTGEKSNNTLRKAILKFGITHPVVNDADFSIWKNYAIHAWPTVVLIDPEGKIVGRQSGEGFYEIVKENIDVLINEYGDRLDRKKIRFQLEKEEQQSSLLRFPSKMIRDHEGHILISDSGNNRIVIIDQNGKILEKIGSGKEGFADGSYQQASFYEPHGLALQGNHLYVADTKNNAIRKVDLKNKTVQTIAGDGSLSYYYLDQSWEESVLPNSPWDLWIEEEEMYIANAGNHQILKMNLKSKQVHRFAGSGREALVDGTLREAAFNQPSGLEKVDNRLYIADAEASAVRYLDTKKQTVHTLIGKGLFDFGDKDGDTDQALLQHCVGLSYHEQSLFIADTYNGKIKKYDFKKERLSTIVSGLNEPNDLLFIGDQLWISDTNNHQIIQVDLLSYEKKPLTIEQE